MQAQLEGESPVRASRPPSSALHVRYSQSTRLDLEQKKACVVYFMALSQLFMRRPKRWEEEESSKFAC